MAGLTNCNRDDVVLMGCLVLCWEMCLMKLLEEFQDLWKLSPSSVWHHFYVLIISWPYSSSSRPFVELHVMGEGLCSPGVSDFVLWTSMLKAAHRDCEHRLTAPECGTDSPTFRTRQQQELLHFGGALASLRRLKYTSVPRLESGPWTPCSTCPWSNVVYCHHLRPIKAWVG